MIFKSEFVLGLRHETDRFEAVDQYERRRGHCIENQKFRGQMEQSTTGRKEAERLDEGYWKNR